MLNPYLANVARGLAPPDPPPRRGDPFERWPYLVRARWIGLELYRVFARCYSLWPVGNCTIASLLAAPILRSVDDYPAWRVAIGHCHRRGEAHAWIQSRFGDVVDLTYAQFLEHPPEQPTIRVVPAALVTDHWPRMELESQEELEMLASMRAADSETLFSATSDMRALLEMIRIS